MQKQKIQIEIDVPDGYEFVRFDQRYESDLDELAVSLPQSKSPMDAIYAICRPIWQWPEWLTAAWIAMDADGAWWAFDREPAKSITRWINHSSECLVLRLDFGSLLNFVPPICDDWTQSPRQNPRNIS